jgi:phosphatidylglycerol:prolipoprotein diacylglycerol transferase
MFPILLKIGPITIYTYGLFVALGFLAGIYYISKISNKGLLKEDALYNLLFGAIVCGIVGARLTYVLLNFGEFKNNFLSIFKLWEGGLVYYGGFIVVLAYGVFYTRKNKISLTRLADIFAPAILLGHFFGRIGCFMAGCCYGKVCSWGVTFTHSHSLAPTGVPLYPTQLFEAFGNLILFFVVHRYNQKPHTAGTTFSLYLILYSVMRFVIEFFRGDDRGAYIMYFSPSQIVSICLFTLGITFFYLLRKRNA